MNLKVRIWAHPNSRQELSGFVGLRFRESWLRFRGLNRKRVKRVRGFRVWGLRICCSLSGKVLSKFGLGMVWNLKIHGLGGQVIPSKPCKDPGTTAQEPSQGTTQILNSSQLCGSSSDPNEGLGFRVQGLGFRV